MEFRPLLVAVGAALTALALPAGHPGAPPGPNAGLAAAAGRQLPYRAPARKHARPQSAARKAAAVPPTPNDPLWAAAWGLHAAGAPAIWSSGEGSPRVVVAVVDTGVDPAQPDLAGALVPGWNTLTGTADTRDELGHGTAVAGTIAARANNGVGASGYCPRCSIMPIKVLDSTGHGPADRIAAGIEWAATHGASVINLSLVLTSRDSSVAAAVADAVGRGILVVAAAGNDGSAAATYPAAEPGVISVAALDPSSGLYPWSSRGSWITAASPGCNVSGDLSHGFSKFCGTSSAAAAASGLVALALSDGASAAAVRAALPAPAGSGETVRALDGRALIAAAVRAARHS